MTDAPVTVTLPPSVEQALTVHPGDTLIVRVSPHLDPGETRDRLALLHTRVAAGRAVGPGCLAAAVDG